MSGSGKCKDNLNFCVNYGATEKQEKNLEAAEKNKEKVKAICTSFSVSRVLFLRNNKNSNVDNFCWSLTFRILKETVKEV